MSDNNDTLESSLYRSILAHSLTYGHNAFFKQLHTYKHQNYFPCKFLLLLALCKHSTALCFNRGYTEPESIYIKSPKSCSAEEMCSCSCGVSNLDI